MEQKKRGLDYMLESLAEEDSLDRFLKRKMEVKQICENKPASQLPMTRLMNPLDKENLETIEQESQKRSNGAGDVVVDSSTPTSSTVTDPDEVGLSHVAQSAVEFNEVVKVNALPLPGGSTHYFTSIEQVEWDVDEETVAAFQTTYDKYIADAVDGDPNEVVQLALKYIHKLKRAMHLATRAESGARQAIETLLHKLNASQRIEYDKLDAEERHRYLKSKTRKAVPGSPAAEKQAKAAKSRGKTDNDKAMKRVNVFVKMGYSEEMVTSNLKEAGLLNDMVVLFIKKAFSKKA